jgi:hypothetical protein
MFQHLKSFFQVFCVLIFLWLINVMNLIFIDRFRIENIHIFFSLYVGVLHGINIRFVRSLLIYLCCCLRIHNVAQVDVPYSLLALLLLGNIWMDWELSLWLKVCFTFLLLVVLGVVLTQVCKLSILEIVLQIRCPLIFWLVG